MQHISFSVISIFNKNFLFFIPAQRTQYSLGRNLKNSGLFPSVFNVAAKAEISVNATCGEDGPETFCKPSESSRCAVCDSRSPDLGKRHNISNVLNSNPGRWWQSPTLAKGDHYEYVTILLDLKQVRFLFNILLLTKKMEIFKQVYIETLHDNADILRTQLNCFVIR